MCEVLVERRDDERIELASALALHFVDRSVHGHAAPVGAIRRECVERIRDQDDPRPERDVRAREPVRVSLAVPALVVVQDELRRPRDAEVADQLDRKSVV